MSLKSAKLLVTKMEWLLIAWGGHHSIVIAPARPAALRNNPAVVDGY